MHLTNYSVNKKSLNFINNKDATEEDYGSKWSLTALRKHLRDAGIDDRLIWAKIEDIIVKTIISAEPALFNGTMAYVPYMDSCFELLGFDILLDDKFSPWLLEVNLGPSLGCGSPLDQKVKGNLMADLFTLAGVVPLEGRKYSDGNARRHYGAYQQLNPQSSSQNLKKK